MDAWLTRVRFAAQYQLSQAKDDDHQSDSDDNNDDQAQQLKEVQELEKILPPSPKQSRSQRVDAKKKILQLLTSNRPRKRSSSKQHNDDDNSHLHTDHLEPQDEPLERISYSSSDWDYTGTQPYRDDDDDVVDDVNTAQNTSDHNRAFYSPALDLNLRDENVLPGRVYNVEDCLDRLHPSSDQEVEEGGRYNH